LKEAVALVEMSSFIGLVGVSRYTLTKSMKEDISTIIFDDIDNELLKTHNMFMFNLLI